MSPKLFIAVLPLIMSNVDWSKYGLKIKNKSLNYLRFADDIEGFKP